MLCAVETASGRAKLSRSHLEHNHELSPPSHPLRASGSPRVKSRPDAHLPLYVSHLRLAHSLSTIQAVGHFTGMPTYSFHEADPAARPSKRIRLASIVSPPIEAECGTLEALAMCAALLPLATKPQLKHS